MNLSTTAFINDVAVKFTEEKITVKTVIKGKIDEIVAEVHTLRNVLSNVEIKKATIDRHMQRGNLILCNNNVGSQCPLAPYEEYFF